MTKVTVVILAKNEQKRIKMCIESVMRLQRVLSSLEVILVDFVSSDQTLEIAKEYPIKILSLSHPDTPAAGMALGYMVGKGDYILFVAGNRVLVSEGLQESLEYLQRNVEVAGVSGRIRSEVEECGSWVRRTIGNGLKFFYDNLPIGDVKVLGGPLLLFRRKALDEVGCFHPFLKAGEEAELSYRLRDRGWRIVRLQSVVAVQEAKCMSVAGFLRKYGWRYGVGVGASLRHTMLKNGPIFRKRILDSYESISRNLLALYSILSIVLLVFGHSIWLIIAGVGNIAILFREYMSKRNVARAILRTLSIYVGIISTIGVIAGFLSGAPSPESFRPDAVVIKE